jgi:hypothetical protein
MKQIRKIAYIALIVLSGFLAITAIAGGISLTANFYAPPVEFLSGSIFKDFTIPGLGLAVLVGGGALVSTILLIRKSKFGVLSATVSGIMIMFFEFVQVLIIGSPAGVAQTLQIIYFGLGTVITIFAIGIWFIDIYLQKGY